MISTQYDGQTVFLLDVQPDWSSGVSAEVSLISQTETGLSNREERRPHSASLRFHTKFSLLAEGADARRVAGALRVLTTEPVLLPLWPAMTTWSVRAAAATQGGLMLVFREDWSQWALYGAGADPMWPAAADLVVPVLWGRLDARAVSWLGPELLQMDVDHVETGPVTYAITPAATVFAAGPQPAAYAMAPRLFPYEINFADALANDFTVAILREQIGFTREPAQTFYSQAIAREEQNGHFLESQAQAAGLLEFFRQHGGGQAFWCPDWVSAVRLTADVGAADTVLTVAETLCVSVGDWLAFSSSASFAVAQVTTVGATTVTLATPPGAFAAGDAVVSHLLLARISNPAVTLQWLNDDYATVKVPIREVPAEYAPAAGETLGTTLGLLPARCYLYEFSRTLAGAVFTDRYTSYESAVTYAGNVYASTRLSHGEIKTSMQADANELQVETDVFVGNPLLLLASLQMESPLYLVVRSADVAAGVAANPAVIFTGEVSQASVKGSRITGTALPGGTIFDRQVPRMLFQLGCNHALFSVGCSLVQANWQFTAMVTNPGTPGYPFAIVLGSLARTIGAAPVYAENWFAGGWAEFGAGAAWQRRAILQSTAAAAGAVTITLDRDPHPYPVANDAIVLYPGCDGTSDTCGAKFNNFLNFGGHPFMPLANPSIIKPPTGQGAGKK
jgi:hypothetical protein